MIRIQFQEWEHKRKGGMVRTKLQTINSKTNHLPLTLLDLVLQIKKN